MLYAGLDLSRRRVEVHVLDEDDRTVTTTWAPPTAEGLRDLALRMRLYGQPVRGVVEAMTGGRFVHDQLELAGWEVELADAARARALAPLAAKTDRIDARVLAELARRDLVPAVFIYHPMAIYVLNQKVQGYAPDPYTSYPRMHDVWMGQ